MLLTDSERAYVMSVRRLVHGTDRELRQLSEFDLALIGLAMDSDGQPVDEAEFDRRLVEFMATRYGKEATAPARREPGAHKAEATAKDNAITVRLKDLDNAEERANAIMGAAMSHKVSKAPIDPSMLQQLRPIKPPPREP